MDSNPGATAGPKKDGTGPKEMDAQANSAPPVVAAQPAVSLDVMEEDFPDPEEDDLDDLDDMLDDFSTTKLDASHSAPEPAEPLGPGALAPKAKTPQPASTETQKYPYDDMDGDELAKQLQAGVDGMINELKKSPEMQEQFEEMFKKMVAADADGPEQLEKVWNQMLEEEKEIQKAAADNEKQMPAAPRESAAPKPEKTAKASSSANPPAGDAGADASFQDTIRRTMERMQTSGEQATAAAASEGGEDFMSEMLKQLSEGTLGAEGSDEDFSKMLMGMMEQLTNKEILYEPMKELHDKFPGWFDKNRGSTAAEDLRRYQEQQVLVGEIVAKFEQSTYSDTNATDREYIVERMQKMQAAGSPPADLVGDMSSAQEAFNAADDQCNPQ
ncbi:pex19 protein family protein [Hirsutella rhossiliensis]|uniref:Pex19 protein family domain-containing protein n=1 Tax=Hirsutella rhossiliensis TaxID=111463 RepID=A0A9P8N6J8_9HYPO|nr:pex19 protein family domain-containing protein [Hirsutella rhossiliensis]KAH0967750.1 pex19 protein family domain-containing protein [Hirsutella rhossiliensis]